MVCHPISWKILEDLCFLRFFGILRGRRRVRGKKHEVWLGGRNGKDLGRGEEGERM